MLLLPVAKLATHNTGVNSVKTIITDGAPDSTVFDLHTTLTICLSADKSHIYNVLLSLSILQHSLTWFCFLLFVSVLISK